MRLQLNNPSKTGWEVNKIPSKHSDDFSRVLLLMFFVVVVGLKLPCFSVQNKEQQQQQQQKAYRIIIQSVFMIKYHTNTFENKN